MHERTTQADLIASFDLIKNRRHGLTVGAGVTMGWGRFDHPDTVVYREGVNVYDGGIVTNTVEWMPNFMLHYDWAINDHWMVFTKVVWRFRTTEEGMFKMHDRYYSDYFEEWITREKDLNFSTVLGTIGLGVGYRF